MTPSATCTTPRTVSSDVHAMAAVELVAAGDLVDLQTAAWMTGLAANADAMRGFAADAQPGTLTGNGRMVDLSRLAPTAVETFPAYL